MSFWLLDTGILSLDDEHLAISQSNEVCRDSIFVFLEAQLSHCFLLEKSENRKKNNRDEIFNIYFIEIFRFNRKSLCINKFEDIVQYFFLCILCLISKVIVEKRFLFSKSK